MKADIIKTCLEESFGKCLASASSQGWMLVALIAVAGLAVWVAWPYVSGARKAVEDRAKQDAGQAIDRMGDSDLRRRYLELFIEDHRHFKFRGLDAQARGVAAPEVGQAFVSLLVVPETTPEPRERSERGHDREASPLGREPVEPLDLAGAVAGSAKLAIIGAAGCGKSTLLQWAGLVAARGGLGQTLREGERAFVDALGSTSLVPVLASLAAFNRSCKEQRCDPSPDAFLRFLEKSTHDAHPTLGVTRAFFESQLRRGCLLMLDGLDEVDPGDRGRVREAVEGLLREFAGGAQNRYLLTARSVAYRGRVEVAEFRKCTVQPLTREQRDALVRAWYAAVHPKNPDEARRSGDDLCARIDRSAEQVKALAVTPLMVTIFALVHFDQRELPRQRADLYEHAVRVLLTERFKPEEVVEALKTWAGMEWQTRRDHLARIAFELHRLREAGDAVAEDDVVSLAWPSFGTDEKPARERARDFVRAAADRGGLLEETGRRYGFFTHRTFREFLAGRYLAEELRPDDRRRFLAACLGDDHWEEPIRLAAGYLAIHGQTRANDFATGLAGLGDTPTERAHALTLAGLALADLPSESVRPETVNGVAPPMVELLTSNPPLVTPVLRRRLGLALGVVGDPRIVPGAPDLVRVPAGPFRMGTSRADAEQLKAQDVEPWQDERAENQIVFVSEFEIGKFPVTNAEFRAFWDPNGDNGYKRQEYWSHDGWRWQRGELDPDLSFIDDDDLRRRYREWLEQRPVARRDQPFFWDRSDLGGPNQPVVGVAWYEAEAFCNWLGQKTGQRYRLPTEAEWEKAARGEGEGHLWPWGDTWDPDRCNSVESKFGAPTPVGMYPDGASPWGALDMVGNVWEWCADRWEPALYESRDGQDLRDPTGPTSGSAKVVRGGAWASYRRSCRVASRFGGAPSPFDVDVGFRVVRPLSVC